MPRKDLFYTKNRTKVAIEVLFADFSAESMSNIIKLGVFYLSAKQLHVVFVWMALLALFALVGCVAVKGTPQSETQVAVTDDGREQTEDGAAVSGAAQIGSGEEGKVGDKVNDRGDGSGGDQDEGAPAHSGSDTPAVEVTSVDRDDDGTTGANTGTGAGSDKAIEVETGTDKATDKATEVETGTDSDAEASTDNGIAAGDRAGNEAAADERLPIAHISIDGGAKHGSVLNETDVEVKDGDTVVDVLKRVTKANKIQMESRGKGLFAYVEGIDNVYEFDEGPKSGWVFRLNGEVITQGAGSTKVNSGDRIEWLFTLDLGKSEGAET